MLRVTHESTAKQESQPSPAWEEQLSLETCASIFILGGLGLYFYDGISMDALWISWAVILAGVMIGNKQSDDD